MQNKKNLIVMAVSIILVVLTYSNMDKIKNSPTYLKLTTDNEFGIRAEDLSAINDSGYNDKTKKLLIKIAQDVTEITSHYNDESWINQNAVKINLHLSCGVLAEMEQNNKVVKVFKTFVNTDERMTANQLFWVTYDKVHGSRPYPTKTDCDALQL